MDKRLKNAVVGQSGGPTAAINATLAGVILGAEKAHSEGKIGTLYGMKNGIDGLQNGMIVDLASFFEDQAKIEALSSTPAAALGSCRKKLPKVEEGGEIYDRVFSVLKENNIGYFFYIGGNDSMDTVAKMNAYAQKIGYDLTVIGVPKTIDNDLVGTDHTPGFGSAAKYIATTVQEIISGRDAYCARAVYDHNPHVRRALDTLVNGTVPTDNDQAELYNAILDGTGWHKADHYYLLWDYLTYIEAKLRVNRDYADRMAFGRKCLWNIASGAKFSSDRTIRQYAEEIWHIEPTKY